MEVYTVGWHGEPAASRETVVSAVLDFLWPRLATAVVSAHAATDLSPLPSDAEAAKRRLVGDGTSIRSRTRNVRLALGDPHDAATLRAFAAWSMSVELQDEQGERVAAFMEGWPVTVMLSPADAQALGQLLPEAEMVQGPEALRRLRVERRQALRRMLRFGGPQQN